MEKHYNRRETATTIMPTEEEKNTLAKLPFLDANKTWKYKVPYYYRWKGYWEIYSKDEYNAFLERSQK